jgi:hypothetical protein
VPRGGDDVAEELYSSATSITLMEDLYITHTKRLLQSPPERIILSNRGDREGSNWICKVSNFLRAMHWGVEVEYLNIKDSDQIFTEPFVLFGKKINQSSVPAGCNLNTSRNSGRPNDLKYSILNWDNSINQSLVHTVKIISQDVVSSFSEKMKGAFVKECEKSINKKNTQSLWNKEDKVVCVHIRLGDVTDEENLDESYESVILNCEKIIGTIESPDKLLNQPKRMNRRKNYAIRCSLSWLRPLKLLINKIEKEHPEHRVCFITSPDSKRIAEEKFPGYEVLVPDKEQAIWSMINSDILILSRSSFSLIAGMLHLGSRVYYPLWDTYASMGLGSKKFDKSNWYPILE